MTTRSMLAIVVMSLSMSTPAIGSETAGDHHPRQRGRVLLTEIGTATYYGDREDGRLTASGEPLDKDDFVAAHPSWPFGTIVKVTSLVNRRSVRVRVIDRGPAAAPLAEGVIIDVSRGAANRLRLVHDGHARVRVQVLKWGDNRRMAANRTP